MNKKVFLLTASFFIVNVINPVSFTDVYRKGYSFEQSKRFEDAVKSYRESLKYTSDPVVVEKVTLKIARLQSDPIQKINEYNQFIERYKVSKYRYLAAYELALTYMMADKIADALSVLYKLSDNAADTPYYNKSLLLAARLELRQNNPLNAVRNAYSVLQDTESYNESALCYHILGTSYSLLGKEKDCIEYFLIAAGSFKDSDYAPKALYQLVLIFKRANDPYNAQKFYNILKKDYPQSQDAHDISSFFKPDENVVPGVNVELIEIEDKAAKDNILSGIIEDLKESGIVINPSEKVNKGFRPGIYIQIGYYTLLTNAEKQLNDYKTRGITDLFIYKGMSAGREFYKIVKGPYLSRSAANNDVIILKDASIESIITEINADYE